MSVDPEPISPLQQAVDELRDAAAAFDERLTEMVTVQRRLISVLRRIDPDQLDALGPQTASELLVELQELSGQLRAHAQRPAHTAAMVAPFTGRPASKALVAQQARQADLAEALPRLLAGTPVDIDVLRAHLHGRHIREAFPLLADGFEQLERAGRMTDPPLAGEQVASLLCELHHVGEQRADWILEASDLPPDVTVGDLGPGDVDRLAQMLRRYAHGFTRDPGRLPRPDPDRGQDPVASSYAAAGPDVADAFISAFGRDAPALEDTLRARVPADVWPADGLQAALRLIEWARSGVLAHVDEQFVVGRPVDSVQAAGDLARHLRPVYDREHEQWRYSDHLDDRQSTLLWQRQEALGHLLSAVSEVVGAEELERVDPLRRRQRTTPRSKCQTAARHVAAAVELAPITDQQTDTLIDALAAQLDAPS